MSFIAKNPLILPKVDTPSSLPKGTRGLFSGEDGFYEIDSDNIVRKLATKEYVVEHVEGLLDNKVDKVSGKGLSEANFTKAEKEKLSQTQIFTNDLKTRLENNTFDGFITAEYNEETDEYEFDFDNLNIEGIYLLYKPERSDDMAYTYYILAVNVSWDKTDTVQFLLNLSNGEMESRQDFGRWQKISVSQTDLGKKADTTALAKKVDKVSGKGLSTNDFTDDEKETLKHINIIKYNEGYYQDENVIFELLQSGKYTDGINIVRSAINDDDNVCEYGLLIVSYTDYHIAVYISSQGHIYYFENETFEDKDWVLRGEKYTPQYYVDSKINAAIGDIETSLDNIIKKYGLGGDGV